MKRILLYIALCFSFFAQGQNDTSLYRELGVKQEMQALKVHAFAREMEPCTTLIRTFDTNQRILSFWNDRRCIGSPVASETKYRYEGDSVIATVHEDDKIISESKSVVKDKRPVYVKRTQFEWNEEYVKTYQYTFGKKKRLTSQIETTVSMNDTTVLLHSYEYTKKGHLQSAYIRKIDGTPVSKIIFTLTEDGVIMEQRFEVYGENGFLQEVYYNYDRDGKLIKTVDSNSRVNTFTYYENGLLKTVLRYNSKGELEAEEFYYYTFHK